MDILDHMRVENKVLQRQELVNVVGGAIKITGSLLSSFSSALNSILDLGRSLGTAIKMMVTKSKC